MHIIRIMRLLWWISHVSTRNISLLWIHSHYWSHIITWWHIIWWWASHLLRRREGHRRSLRMAHMRWRSLWLIHHIFRLSHIRRVPHHIRRIHWLHILIKSILIRWPLTRMTLVMHLLHLLWRRLMKIILIILVTHWHVIVVHLILIS